MYFCHHFLISSAFVRSLPFLSFIMPHLRMKCSLGISNFLEEISTFSHSIVVIGRSSYVCFLEETSSLYHSFVLIGSSAYVYFSLEYLKVNILGYNISN